MAYTYKKRVNTNSSHSAGFPGGSPFTKNSATGGNCTWWAWGRFKEVYKLAKGKDLSWTAGAGNACMFYSIMGKAGYKTGKTPKPGAIICWGYNKQPHGQPGHVAFVEQVFKNGDIEISQSGWSSGPLANRRITKSSNYAFSSTSYFNGFIYNKVEFTNPDGTTAPGGGSTADHPKSWYTNKYGNEARVYFQLRDLKYSHIGTCAIMGNIAQESNFNTSVTSSDGYGSQGLCQWTGSRLTNLKNFAKSKGLKWNSVECQCKFLDKELKDGYKELRNKLLNGIKGSLETLTDEFCDKFERPAAQYANKQNRRSKAKTYNSRYKNAYGGGGSDEEGGEEAVQAAVNMEERISQLYSSNNYNWIVKEEEQESEEEKNRKAKRDAVKDYLTGVSVILKDEHSGAIPDFINIKPNRTSGRLIKTTNSIAPVSQAMVEAPFVELDFNGTIIGTFRNSVDEYPNHITSLEVEKVNGEINKYTFVLTHQIRPGEDPNLIDKVLSKVKYDKIGIRYGDFNSNVIYGDEKAIITNVAMNRDYVNNRISYTIYATSANELITSHKINFSATTDKPSNVINSLLYNNSETSELLLDAFPGMKNKSLVDSKNLIPNNDTVLDIDEQLNVNSIEYINYLVSCMSNSVNDASTIIRNSVYYISYENDFNNMMGGSYFNIKEQKPNLLNKYNTNTVFEVTVGYPDNNYVMGFTVDNNIAWSLLYKNAKLSDEYIYSINDSGAVNTTYSPNITSSTNVMNEIQKNWWTQMTHFPVNASLTLKGFMKPVMLMDYVIVNVVFYGNKHISSGVYTITGQKDTLSGEGFRTTLALTRVGAN